jgi:hypothetical protein
MGDFLGFCEAKRTEFSNATVSSQFNWIVLENPADFVQIKQVIEHTLEANK